MSDQRVADMLQAAAEQERQQQAIGQALQAAMNTPHTITRRAQFCAVGMREEPGAHPEAPAMKVLMIAGLDGHRIDVPLSPQIVALLHRETAPPVAATGDES